VGGRPLSALGASKNPGGWKGEVTFVWGTKVGCFLERWRLPEGVLASAMLKSFQSIGRASRSEVNEAAIPYPFEKAQGEENRGERLDSYKKVLKSKGEKFFYPRNGKKVSGPFWLEGMRRSSLGQSEAVIRILEDQVTGGGRVSLELYEKYSVKRLGSRGLARDRDPGGGGGRAGG